MGRRILSIILVLCLALTILPIEALAIELEEENGEVFQELAPESRFEDTFQQNEDINDVSDVDPAESPETTSEDTAAIDSAETDRSEDIPDTDDETEGDEEETDPNILGSGFCGGEGNGENLQWTLSTDGVLHIWGTGKMSNCVNKNSSWHVPNAPWYDNRANIREVVIDNGVTVIGTSAFCNCYNLESVTMPDSIISICPESQPTYSDETAGGRSGYVGNSGAFYGCSKLKTIQLSSNLTTIGVQAFRACTALESITIPAGVTYIGACAFQSCSSLRTVEFASKSTCTSINRFAFEGCSALPSLNFLPDSITSIDAYAFQNCTGLTDLMLPNNLETIGGGGFYWSAGWELNGYYHGYVFDGCTNLETLTIPESVNMFYTPRSNKSTQKDGMLCPKSTLLIVVPDSAAETYAKTNNHKYQYASEGRALSVKLLDENDVQLTEGFTAIWYDADGNSIGASPTLSGADLDAAYTFEVQLGEELSKRYEQPERQTIAPEDEAIREVRLVLRPTVPTLALTGRVLDAAGQPVNGALVSVSAANGDPIETTTDTGGRFIMTIPCAVMQIAIQKDGYYSKRQFLDLSNESGDTYAMADCILTEVITISDRITLDITQKMAVEGPEEAAELPVISAKSLEFTVTGEDGRSITNFEVQGTALLFETGSVSANETITIMVADPAGTYVGAVATIMLDNDRLGSAELVMTEKGHFRLGNVAGPEATLLVFDNSGKCIQTGAAQSGMCSGAMDAGNYYMVLLQKSDLLQGAASLDYLRRVGLTEGRDYLLREFTISNGQITTIGDCTVPALNESALSYTVAESTSITTNKSSGAAVGELILIRAAYQLDASKGMTAGTLRIALPVGVDHLAQYSATLNGASTPYTFDSATREICIPVAGQDQATIYVYCTAVEGGTHNISASLAFSSGAVQPIGTAAVQVERAKLNVAERVGIATGLTASGKTLPNSTVVLYDNDEVVGRTASNAVGSWSMKFDLVQPVYSYSYHFVRAVTENSSLSEPIATEESMITYNKDSAGQVTKITMYNTAHTASNLDPWEQETVFDFVNSESTVKPYYRIWPSQYPTFTFKVEFDGDASKLSDVYVATTNSAGDETYVKTTYDATSNAWVGTHDYKSFYDAPVRVGATYSTEDYNFAIDEDMIEDLERISMESYQKTSDILTDTLRDIWQISNVEFDNDCIIVSMNWINPDTKKPDFSADFYVTASFIDESVTEECLIQNGYTCINKEFQLWASDDDTVFPEEVNYIFLTERVRLTSTVTQRQVYARTAETSEENTAISDVLSWSNLFIGIYVSEKYSGKMEQVGHAAKTWDKVYGEMRKNPKPSDVNEIMEWRAMKRGLEKAAKGLKILGKGIAGVGWVLDEIDINSDQKGYKRLLYGRTGEWNHFIEKEEEKYNRLKKGGRLTADQDVEYQERLAELKKLTDDYKRTCKNAMDLERNSRQGIAGGSLIVDLFADLSAPSAFAAGIANTALQEGAKRIADVSGKIKNGSTKIEDALKQLGEFSEQLLDNFRDDMYAPFFFPGMTQYTLAGALVSPINDPSGFVYEAVPSNRLADVTAVISCEAEGGAAWNAGDYDQINPQITSADGGYYWDVPQGNWKVSFTKDSYDPADTSSVPNAVNGWLPVPPPQLEINVGMVSKSAPTVKHTVAYGDQVEIEFSQYMDIGSVKSALSLTQNGTVLSGCTIEPLNAEYNLENTIQYATRFAIVPSGGNLAGELAVSVDSTALNYVGMPLIGAYTSPAMTVSVRPTDITAPDTVSVILHDPTSINIVLQPEIAGQKLTIESLTPDLVAVSPVEITTGVGGSATFTLTGNLPGSGLIRISDPISGLSKTVAVKVGAVKNIPPASEHIHSWAATWSSDANNHWHNCTAENCSITTNSQKDGYTAHTSDNGKVTTVATAYQNGVRVYSCTVCGYVIRTESIPATSGTSSGNEFSSSGGYSINLPNRVTGGTVKVMPTSASENQRVTITVKPDNGYTLEKLTVTDSKGNELELSEQGDGKYTFRMPSSKVSVNVVFQLAEKAWNNPFSDVAEGAWYFDAVKFVNQNGLMNGVENGLFAPNSNLSRAMLVEILYNKEGRPAVTAGSTFTDVQSDTWYADAVAWAASKDIVGGYGNGKFGPNDNITREQLAVILWRYAGEPTAAGSKLNFTDADKTSSWVKEAMLWATEKGIINGKGNGILEPAGKATRAEAAQMLKNYLEK